MKASLAAIVAVALSTSIAAHGAQPSADPEPIRFEIRRYVLDGNTLLPAPDAERLLSPYRGQGKDFGDIQRALEALTEAYREMGYGVVQVTLPEQNISQGEIRFVIVEPRLGKVAVEGHKFFSEANVRASVPALREGHPPNSRAIGRSLQVANENPSKQTQVTLRAGSSEDQVDASIKVVDERFWKAGVTVDNTGTASTGRWRIGTSYQHGNVLGLDHVLTAQYITSPGHWGDVRVLGLGYRVPLYGLGSSIDVVGGYSDVDSGTLQNLFSVSGKGSIFGLRYNQYLPRTGDYEHRLVYGFDYRAYQNSVAQIGGPGGSTVPDITVHPVSVYYAGQWRPPGSELSFYAYVAQNVFSGGNDASDADFKRSRVDARAAYRLYRYHVNYARALPNDFQARVAVYGQETHDALTSGEQFGVGGAENVRGFDERELVNDRGRRVTLEVTSPDLAAAMKLESLRMRAGVFYDWATLRRRLAQPGDVQSETIASAGIGLRVSAANRYVLRVDMARVQQAGAAQQRGDWKLHAAFSASF